MYIFDVSFIRISLKSVLSLKLILFLNIIEEGRQKRHIEKVKAVSSKGAAALLQVAAERKKNAQKRRRKYNNRVRSTCHENSVTSS